MVEGKYRKMQEILYVIILSLGSIVVMFILTKLMGCRQMSQLSMFDYINGITIGSIAAEMATSYKEDFVGPLVAMIVYGLVAVILSFIASKSMYLRRIINGKSTILLDNGIIYEKNLRKSRVDINEFLTQCRISGYFDIGQIKTAVLEENGKISFLPFSENRNLQPSDINIEVEQESLCANVIIDGNIMKENLKSTGKDEKWLRDKLSNFGAATEKDVLLATYISGDKLNVYTKNNTQLESDIL